jgi:hypothetical protein
MHSIIFICVSRQSDVPIIFYGVKHIVPFRIFVNDAWQTTYLGQRTETKVLYALACEVS